MPRRGRDLEKLAASIERQLNGAEDITVHSPAFLTDTDTGERREHDVLIVVRRNHHELKIGLECRDRKAKVDSADVGAFCEKCQTTGINSGVIVSSSGFTRPALEKAEKKSIRCLTLAQAEQFNWCHCQTFVFQQPEILEGLFECVAADEIARPYKVFREDDTEFTGSDAGKIAINELKKAIPIGTMGGPHKHLITYGPQPGYVIGADGKRQDILGVNIWLMYKMNDRLIPLQFHQYADAQSGGEITTAVTATFDVAGHSAQLMMIKNPDESISVTMTPPTAAELKAGLR